jgi:anti-sigma factor ChrR (cupin superfamily)
MKHCLAASEMTERAALHALGALTPDEARELEEHLAAGCAACAEERQAFERVVAKLCLAAWPQEPPAAVRGRLLAQVSTAAPPEAALASPPPAARSFLTVRADQGEWHEMGPGVYIKQLFADRERRTITSLFKLLPGAHLPRHRHLGVEECVMLAGDFHANGEVLGPGDYRCALPDSVDETLYTEGGALFLLITPQDCEMLDAP